MIEEQQQFRRGERLWLWLIPMLGQLTLSIVLAIMAMALFVVVAHEVGEGETRRFDTMVLRFFATYRSPVFFRIMKGVSWLAGGGPQSVIVILSALYFAVRRRLPELAAILLGGIGGLGLIVGLKYLFQRPRPEQIFDHLGYSFPSGHSFFAVVIYGMIAYWLTRDMPWRRRREVYVLTTAIVFIVGFSRVVVGEHFPSDVLAGFAVGIPWLWGCLALPTAFHRRGRNMSMEEIRARYLRGRERVKEAAVFVPHLVQLATGLLRDSRVPRSRKIGLALLAAYLAFPIDLIPDFIPILGMADDLIIASLVLGWVLKAVPAEAVQEHWHGRADLAGLLSRTREGVKNMMNRD